MEHAGGDWALVTSITHTQSRLHLLLLTRQKDRFSLRSLEVTDPPFYVGEDIWELEYGSVLMTLHHPTLRSHPAKKMYDE